MNQSSNFVEFFHRLNISDDDILFYFIFSAFSLFPAFFSAGHVNFLKNPESSR